jgi:thermolabile hemolysin
METIMMRIIKWTVLTLLFAVLGQTAGFAAPFDEIVVFGDSLSDNGNLVLVEGQPLPDPELYYKGRFSNGPVWVEYLADPEHFDATLTDLALGGARTDGLDPPGLVEQVTAYITAADFTLSPTALFIIWIGGNDFLNGDGNFQEAVANIKSAMEQLVQYGAMQILVLNLPDLGAIPDTLGTPEAAEATAFSANFNAELGIMLDQFSVEHPDIALYEFDVASFYASVRSDPSAFGFSNVSEPSPNFAVPNNFDGAGHVFWDDIHPTTEIHLLLADRVFADLNAQLPETGENNASQEDDDSQYSCFIGAITIGSR